MRPVLTGHCVRCTSFPGKRARGDHRALRTTTWRNLLAKTGNITLETKKWQHSVLRPPHSPGWPLHMGVPPLPEDKGPLSRGGEVVSVTEALFLNHSWESFLNPGLSPEPDISRLRRSPARGPGSPRALERPRDKWGLTHQLGPSYLSPTPQGLLGLSLTIIPRD